MLIEHYAQQGSVSMYVLDSIQAGLVAMQSYIPANVAVIWSDVIQRVQTRVMSVSNDEWMNDECMHAFDDHHV